MDYRPDYVFGDEDNDQSVSSSSSSTKKHKASSRFHNEAGLDDTSTIINAPLHYSENVEVEVERIDKTGNRTATTVTTTVTRKSRSRNRSMAGLNSEILESDQSLDGESKDESIDYQSEPDDGFTHVPAHVPAHVPDHTKMHVNMLPVERTTCSPEEIKEIIPNTRTVNNNSILKRIWKQRGAANRERRNSIRSSQEYSSNSYEKQINSPTRNPTGKRKRRGSSLGSLESILGRRMGIWSRFMNKDGFWKYQGIETGGQQEDDPTTCTTATFDWFKRTTFSIKNILSTAIRNPIILIFSMLVFLIICIAGIGTIHSMAALLSNELKNEAEDTALKCAASFSKALDDASRGPLFAISQFVKHLNVLKDLPYEIGHADGSGLLDTGVAPLVNGTTNRDLSNTSVADPKVIELFNSISKNVKDDADLDGILVNLQLAPMGVVSLVYPLVNYEDFEDPIFMNNTKAIGHDLLFDEKRVAGARKTLASSDPVVVGPLTLIQSEIPIVKECFIIRLAINMPGYLINVPQEEGPDIPYESWGFAVAILNWEQAKQRSGIYNKFKTRGMEFSLTRVDDGIEKKVVQIANSTNWEILDDINSVVIQLPTSNNIWTMRVGFPGGFDPSWKGWMECVVVFISFSIGALIMVVLVVRKQYQTLLYSMMPPQIISRLRKGKTVVQMYDNATIFFSDIVEFTTISGNMTPIEVMKMLNEIYTEFDRLVKKYGVYKVETIGDAYIVIGGGPDKFSGAEGAKRVALFALDVMNFVKEYRTENEVQIFLRAGLASGPAVGGVVGTSMPKFTLFGDTVNLASRMESTSKPMKIQCTALTYNLLRAAPDFEFEFDKRYDGDKDSVKVKGKGFVKTWWVLGSKECKN